MLRLVGPSRAKQETEEPAKERGDSVTVRMPLDIRAKLDSMRTRGYGTSAALFLMCRAFMEIEAELGSHWWDVEKAGAEQRVGVGVILGRLAKSMLEGRKR